MKNNLFVFSLTIVFAFATAISFAQNDEPEATTNATPRWVSKMGYWVVESNIHKPKHNIIYFYNNDKVLVYKETMDGIALKLHKRRTKMRLKKLVDKTVTAYVQKQKAAENEMLVLHQLK